jgi:ATP-dependent exoDNAse (exonuclease V) beta subunit
MKKVILVLLLIILTTGCSVVRIDTSNIDNIVNVILTKDNKLYNQVGQGYKYYLPGGVTYIDSDDLNGTIIEKSTNFDCVQIMTIHASKGLQFPVVISVAGFKQRNNKNTVYTIYHTRRFKL